MTSNNDWENFLDTAIPQLLDRKPITFNRQHKVISKSLVKFFNKKNGEILTLKHTMIRNRFLYHCHLLTKNESIEYAIIGYGKKRGQGTDIKKVQVIKGEYDNVSIPQSTFNRIDKLFNQNLKNEVVIFHNHPSSVFSEIPII